MPSTKTPDLHDCEKTLLEGADGETVLVERVTLPDRDEAVRWMADELALDAADLDPQPVFMRWEAAPPDKPFKNCDGFEFDWGWHPCREDHPDAVPFWRETPR